MNHSPFVSIIIPMYNAEDTIAGLLEHLLEQTYRSFEVVIVNDHSTDSCLQICKAYQNRLSMTLIDLPENRGVSNARNVGIANAQGEYLTFIDSDDYVKPTYIEHLMTSESDDYVVCGYTRPHRETPSSGESIRLSVDKYRMHCFEMWSTIRITNVWGVRYKTGIIRENQIRYDETMHWGEDTLFNIHYLSQCKSMHAVPHQDYVYCVNTNSLSARYEPTRHSDAVKVAKAFAEFLPNRDQCWKIMFMYWEMSAKHYLNHRRDPMDSPCRKQLFQNLSCSEKDPFFRQYLPDILAGGTLDMKLFALCLKFHCTRLFPSLNKLLMLLSGWKQRMHKHAA